MPESAQPDFVFGVMTFFTSKSVTFANKEKDTYLTNNPGTDRMPHNIASRPMHSTIPRSAPVVFFATLFASALLLFALEPMITKMLLPRLGGSASVWNSALLLFQVLLLLGYLYAHFLSRLPFRRGQVIIHGLLLLATLVFLPPGVADVVSSGDGLTPVIRTITALAAAIGLPFLALAATAPLLQHWFSLSDHPDSEDPYFLYAASNAGSLVALIAYPTIIEPFVDLSQQAQIWSVTYVVLAATIVLAGLLTIRGINLQPDRSGVMSENDRNEPKPVDWPLRLRWLAWSFVPSAMLLAVTLHISIDIAATPFLWVLPLALYLLTFVISFSRRSLIPAWLSNRLHAWVTIGVVLYFAAPDPMLVLGLHIGMLFFTGLVCHQALARQRPHVARLTEFYLWISLGGCLGGVFGALISPMVFDSLLEYPILIVAAALLRPTLSPGNGRSRLLDLLLPLAVGLYALTPRLLPSLNPLQLGGWGALIFYALLIYALDRFKDRPLRFGLSTAVLLAIVLLYQSEADVLGRWRTFYGVYEVTETPNGKVRQLHHGTTLHGAQAVDPRYHRLPLTYFTLDAPLGQVVSALRGEGKLKDIVVMGLGVGTLACHFRSGERLTFFEIDPLVAEIAGDERLFSYLSACNQAEVQIRINDGRLGLEKLPDRSLDLIVMDAFSSDAIPTHLITQEAIQGYTAKLREGGAVLIHVSNRYVDMVPILGEIASSLDLVALHQHYVPTQAERRRFAASSNWLLILPPWQDDHVLAKDERWKQVAGNVESAVWTDERSSLLPSLRWNRLLWARGAPD